MQKQNESMIVAKGHRVMEWSILQEARSLKALPEKASRNLILPVLHRSKQYTEVVL